MTRALVFGIALSVLIAGASQPADTAIGASARSCDGLTSLAIAHATVTSAQDVHSTFSTPATSGAAPTSLSALPPFCRVTAALKPSADSDIQVEVWLPAVWNGKYQAVGNGAWSGSISYAAMAEALRRGYATSSTDTGHVGNTARFALGHPEKLIDFAYRSEHEMTMVAKAIIRALYGGEPVHSYWNGCSAGGRQALKEAQMFPMDYDGIIAGAPGLDWSGRSAQAVRVAHALQNPAARLLDVQRQLLHDAALQACDAADGLKDGLIADPTKCLFDPAALACRTDDGQPGCLTSAQVTAAQLIYRATAVNDRRKLAGLMPGSELGWTDFGWSASARATGRDQYRFVVFHEPSWDVDRFNEQSDISAIDAPASAAANATDPNLKPFFDRGGKLLHYHGWSDAQISPLNSVDYFSRVVATVGQKSVDQSYRLFMAPGMAHCGGGDGPNDFDKIGALERWVETGEAPGMIVASHSRGGAVDRTRPLCAYPQIATYKGAGSVDEAANFVCK